SAEFDPTIEECGIWLKPSVDKHRIGREICHGAPRHITHAHARDLGIAEDLLHLDLRPHLDLRILRHTLAKAGLAGEPGTVGKDYDLSDMLLQGQPLLHTP